MLKNMPAGAFIRLQVFQHQERDQGGAHLNSQGIGACAHEGLEAQNLFEGAARTYEGQT